MPRVNQLKVGVIITYITLILGNLIPIIYTPIMLRIIGQDEYGLYNIARSAVSYLSLLSFGVGNSMVRYISKYRALDDRENEEKTFGLFLMVYAVLSLLVMGLGIVLSLNTELVFSRTFEGEDFSRMRILLILMSLNVVITFIGTVFSSVIVAHERFIFNKLLALFTTFLSPAASLVMLYMGYASIGMAAATVLVGVVSLVGNFLYCRYKLKIRPRFRNPSFEALREIIRFSLFIFLAEIANILYFATDKVLLGVFVSKAAVSVYTIGATFSDYMNMFTTGISSVMMPRITSMVFKGASQDEINSIFIRIGRLQFIIVSFVLSAFIVFGRQFMPIFAGEGYSDSYIVALIIMIPLSVPLIQSVAVNIITAKNKHKFRSVTLLCVAAANVILTLIMLKLGFGYIGAAIASAIAYVVGTIFILNWYYYKKIGLDIPLFWKNIAKLLPTPVIMLVAGLAVTHFVDVSGIVRFVIGAVIFTVIYFAFLIPTLNEYEKNLFFSPFKKIKGKLKGAN